MEKYKVKGFSRKPKHPLLKLFTAFISGVKMAILEIGKNRLRSFLSVLGVLLGVTAMVAMMTLIGGVDQFLNRKMSVWVGGLWFEKSSNTVPEKIITAGRSPGLRLSDGEYLMDNSPYVKTYLRMVAFTDTVLVDDFKEEVIIRGVDSATFAIDKKYVVAAEGQFFNSADYAFGLRKCLISWELEDVLRKKMKLEKDASLIGKICSFHGMQTSISGIIHPMSGNFKPWHMRKSVLYPISTLQKNLLGRDPPPGRIQLQVKEPAKFDMQKNEIIRTLIEKHRGVKDFVYEAAAFMDDVKRTLDNVKVLMAIISVISLIVGGLSIMNVMLSSIAERIKEIGIRKALGATNGQIFVQFITETGLLCFIGGMIGFFIGLLPILFKNVIANATDGVIEPVFLPFYGFLTLTIVVSIGIIFGIYPAIFACRLNPVDALRYE